MAAENDMTPEEKLLRMIQKGGAETSAPDVPEAAPVLGDNGDAGAPASPRRAATGLHIRGLARLLSLLAALLAGGAAYEIYANLPSALWAPPPVDLAFLATSQAPELPRIDDTLDMFAKRRLFGPPTSGTPTNIIDVAYGWRAYVRDNFKIMGISWLDRTGSDGQPRRVSEAIVVDNGKDLMHFLSAGQTLVIEKDEVLVEAVSGDEIVFASGDTRMNLKK